LIATVPTPQIRGGNGLVKKRATGAK
jgi:hypothetical protein